MYASESAVVRRVPCRPVDGELLEPGVTGAWSVRDIIAHVTTRDEEALGHLFDTDGHYPIRA